MKGIIVKPKSCCGDKSQIGVIVEYVGKAPSQLFGCRICIKPISGISLIEVKTSLGLDLVEYRAIKWFNDELDKEIEMESNEDLVKEKETV